MGTEVFGGVRRFRLVVLRSAGLQRYGIAGRGSARCPEAKNVVSRTGELVIDDRAMTRCRNRAPDFWETCEDRYRVCSTSVTWRFFVSGGHEQVADPTPADGNVGRQQRGEAACVTSGWRVIRLEGGPTRGTSNATRHAAKLARIRQSSPSEHRVFGDNPL